MNLELNALLIFFCCSGRFWLQLFSKVTKVARAAFVNTDLGIPPTLLSDLSATF